MVYSDWKVLLLAMAEMAFRDGKLVMVEA